MGKLRSRAKSLFVDTDREKQRLHDEYEEQAEEAEEIEEVSGPEIEEIDEEDKQKMFRIFDSILQVLPDNDCLSHKQRLNRIKWGKIECEDLSPLEVKQKVSAVLGNIRKYRNLKEMLEEAREFFSGDADFVQSSRKGLTNGYLIYLKENKARIMHENPSLYHAEIMKLVAYEYRNLPKEEKAEYKRRAKTHNTDLLGEEVTPTPSKKKKKKKIMEETEQLQYNFIKKESVEAEYPEPMRPFEIFEHKMRLRDPTKSLHEVKTAWRALSGQEKAKYILKALKMAKNTGISIISKEEQKILNEIEGRPSHPGTAFSEFMSENKHLNMMKIVELWRNMAESEKKRRLEACRESFREYKSKMAEFLDTLTHERRELEKTSRKRKSKNAEKRKSKSKKKVENVLEIVKSEPEASTSESGRKKKTSKRQSAPESPEILPSAAPKRKRRATTYESDDDFEDTPRFSPKKIPKLEESCSSMINGEPKSKRSVSKKRSKKGAGEMESPRPMKLAPPVQPVSTVYDYYCKFVYQGPAKHMETSWKNVRDKQKKQYFKIVKNLNDQYMMELESYLESLTPKEIEEFTKQQTNSRS